MRILRDLALVVIGALLSALVTPYAADRFEQNKTPMLIKESSQPLSSLSEDERSTHGITLWPVTYDLRHMRGGTAKNISILIAGPKTLKNAQLQLSPESEKAALVRVDDKTTRVDVPEIRPGGRVHFSLTVPGRKEVSITERAEQGTIMSEADYRSIDTARSQAVKQLLIGLVIVIWILLLTGLIAVVWRLGRRWHQIETSAAGVPAFSGSLVWLIAGVLIYNVVGGALGPFAIMLPTIRVSELFWALAFYLLATRYRLIEDALRRRPEIETPVPDGKPENHA